MNNGHRVIVILIASATAMCCGPGLRVPTGPVVSVTGCGVAEVVARVTDDPTWVAGEVISRAAICTVHPAYSDGPPALELRRAGSSVGSIEDLPEPHWFVDFREGPAIWTPSFESVTEWDADHVLGTVPAGAYFVVLRYTVAPCRRELVRNVCIARSETFTINEPIKYVIERAEGGR